MTAHQITLLSRPGCHLCEEARDGHRAGRGRPGRALVRSGTSPSPRRTSSAYWEMIPVTLIDGVQHDYWRVSEDRLRAALRE